MGTPLDIGAALVEARRACGMTQQEFGAVLGVTQPQIARWEAMSYRSASLANVDAVSRVLGVVADVTPVVAAETQAPYYLGTDSLGDTATRALARLGVRPETIAAFCRLHGIAEFALFGSSVRKDFKPASDVDVLVTWEEGRRPTDFSDFLDLQETLSAVFRRPVDLVDRTSVEASENYLRRERILQGARNVYVAR